jgi:hypothetical protein
VTLEHVPPQRRPAFQRRHYQAIAEALATVRPTPHDRKAYSSWCEAALAIADVFRSDNPRFDDARFWRAASR